MYLLSVDRLCQGYEYDREDKTEHGTEWQHSVSVIPCMDKKEAIKYLSAMKKEYHAKGRCSSGKITGRKVTKESNESVIVRWVEEIYTELNEAKYGKEISVSMSCDVGEY